MTDNETFSNFLPQGEVDETLDTIERAMLRLEQIMLRHGQTLSQAGRLSRGQKNRRTLIRGLEGVFGLFSASGRQNHPSVSGDYSIKNNRFPASQGQMMADLATLLRHISGRNL